MRWIGFRPGRELYSIVHRYRCSGALYIFIVLEHFKLTFIESTVLTIRLRNITEKNYSFIVAERNVKYSTRVFMMRLFEV